MFKPLIRSFFSFLILIPLSVYSVEKKDVPFNWQGSLYKIVHKHQGKFTRFSKSICHSGDEKKYWDLLKKYRSSGFYLPKVEDDIDRVAIKSNLKQFYKKIKYIKKLEVRLKKNKTFPNYKTAHLKIEETIKSLLKLKKMNHLSKEKEKKKKIREESRSLIKRLKEEYTEYLKKIFFLKSFNFPNDLLDLRVKYERVKHLEHEQGVREANQVFFYRRIVEDGAYDPDNLKPDRHIRSTLDTIYINLQKEKDFLSENIRFDLGWVTKNVQSLIKRGQKIHLTRLKAWRKRTQEKLDFYREIIKINNKERAKKLISEKNKSSEQLRAFVYKKHADIYKFWAKQPLINRALFSLETILIHEVGTIDGKDGLERKSVVQVAINRFFDDFYNKLSEKQHLKKYLGEDFKTKDFPWLNVLFKIGEFSFTYHYIPAVVHTFCPDMSKRGKSIRSKNLKIALESLRSFDHSFLGFRYVSRISMPGKIDMASAWDGYERMAEFAGNKLSGQKKLLKTYHSNEYEYYYSFESSEKIKYDVIRMNDKTYSMRWERGNPVFYSYRSPHLFTYFSKKK